MTAISIINAQSYDIVIGCGLRFQIFSRLKAMGYKQVALVVDETVWRTEKSDLLSELASVLVDTAVIASGERSKRLEQVAVLYGRWVKAGVGRETLILAVGGGVVGDLTGFAAATYMRGLAYIQVPTTLLAQVDSSIGCKTAVNLPEGKNLVGSFHEPQAVWIDPEYLRTLPEKERRSGMAEVIKAACIGDLELLKLLLVAKLPMSEKLLVKCIERAVRVKVKVVLEDPHEKDQRRLLNFGHTLGHALESMGNYERWSHGEAVSLGMVAITRATESMGKSTLGVSMILESLLQKYGLPVCYDWQIEAVRQRLLNDKKNTKDHMNWVILEALGSAKVYKVPMTSVPTLLEAMGGQTP